MQIETPATICRLQLVSAPKLDISDKKIVKNVLWTYVNPQFTKTFADCELVICILWFSWCTRIELSWKCQCIWKWGLITDISAEIDQHICLSWSAFYDFQCCLRLWRKSSLAAKYQIDQYLIHAALKLKPSQQHEIFDKCWLSIILQVRLSNTFL